MTGALPEEVWALIRDHHYSGRMPSIATHCFAWPDEGGLFGDNGTARAAVVYGPPGNRHWPPEALELHRLVRCPDLAEPLSQLVAWSLRWLRANTAAPFVLSYADSGEGHHGGIYQAAGFSFVRYLPSKHWQFHTPEGKRLNGRSLNAMIGTSNHRVVARRLPHLTATPQAPKYLYVKPLRQNLKPLLKRFGWELLPFPKPDLATRPLDERATSASEPEASSGGRSTFQPDAPVDERASMRAAALSRDLKKDGAPHV